MDLAAFFREEGIDIFSEVSMEALTDPDRASVQQFFPLARSVIIFGKEIPVAVYGMPQKEKTREMLRIAEALDDTALRLAGLLEEEKFPAVSVPLYLPVRVADGKVQGLVSLKHIAAAGGLGEIGTNTLLLTPRFGPRLFLSGVVTARPAPGSGQAGKEGFPLCTECGRCIRVCPQGALGPDGVDPFRCRTVSAWVPPALVPAVLWMLSRQLFLRCIAPLAPVIARGATIRCSLCATECPNFPGDEGRDPSPVNPQD